MEVPFGVSATIACTETASKYTQLVWKPNANQQGPTWWKADPGDKQPIAMVRIHWAKPGTVAVRARRVFVQRTQTRQPPHAGLANTAASARTNSRSNPGPTPRLRPLLSTTSTRGSPTARGAGVWEWGQD